MKKLFFLIFIFQILYTSQSNINTWTSKELWNYIEFELSNKPLNKNYFLIDPNRHLYKFGKNEMLLIENAQKKLFEETKIPNYIIFISNINLKKESIEDFTFSIAKHIYIKFPDVNITNSIITVFGIQNRKMRIRTGTILKNKILDSTCLQILNNRKSQLRKGNYNKVALDLINDILLAYNNKFNSYNIFIIILIIIIIIFIIITLIIYCITKENKEEYQLNKIREYLRKVKTNKKFVSESCVICLENFDNINNVSSLPCGHQFHTKCITEWMLKSKTCPLCKKEIKNLNISNENKSSNLNSDNNLFGERLSERIWEVQREIFPNFANINYSNLWKRNINRSYNRSSNETSYCSRDNDFSCDHDTGGGATSDW